MKNKFKKLGITALACVLSLTTAGTVANLVNSGNTGNGIFTKLNAEGTGHITINANVGDNGVTQSLAGKKFNIYRIFDAQNSAGMESINYTMNPAYEKSLKKVTGKDTEYAIIDYIQTLNNNQVINDVSQTQKNETAYSNFRYFVESLRNMLVEDKADPTQVLTVPSTATDSYTLDVAYGWYIIDEITSVNGTHSAASMIMVNTANPDVAIDIKSDFPVIQKQILEDDNQKNIGADKDGWNDVGDYEIGQTVPYRYLTYAPDMNG
ncbi:cell wall anchor protein, partial [Erysipelatoclostridium ramosum]|nr:cell wall anchor protein [Thomasclavelia ramosa]MBV3167677.1 cell wall anchor protein [Erysipelatoclostridium sp. MSK.23.68]MBV3181961.1 cell wall anchor protein [Erysipelatoclostridium sp. MSK.23.67]MBV3248639.1 cell wall anchor protein [Erysipelatoclostridium sp. MSK.23.31]MBV3144953.1 cell wall anchor protein [Thomasclavelia ramosa]